MTVFFHVYTCIIHVGLGTCVTIIFQRQHYKADSHYDASSCIALQYSV